MDTDWHDQTEASSLVCGQLFFISSNDDHEGYRYAPLEATRSCVHSSLVHMAYYIHRESCAAPCGKSMPALLCTSGGGSTGWPYLHE